MISAILKGRGFRGVLRYVLDPAKASLLGGTFEGDGTAEGIAFEFGRLRELNPRVKVPVFHGILSLDCGERLSDAVWIGVAQEYLEQMGYTDTPYLVARHTDTDNDHIHLIASRIRRDGSCVSDSNDWRRSEALCRAFEERLSLRRVAWSDEARQRRPARGARELALRTGEGAVHARLQETLRRAAERSSSLEGFFENLEQAGVSVVLRRRDDGTPYGLSYSRDGVAFKASSLGRSFTLAGLAREHGLTWAAGGRRLGAGGEGGSFPRETPPRRALDSAWSPAALRELLAGTPRLPGRRSELAEIRNAFFTQGTQALRRLLSAPSLVQRLTSPRSLARGLLRRLPGGAGLDLALAFPGAFRSPLAALTFAARLAGHLAAPPAGGVERDVVRLFVRAAAADRPDLETFGRRLAEAGIAVHRDGRNLRYTLQGTTWTTRELGGLATLRGLALEGGTHVEPGRPLPGGAAGGPPGGFGQQPPPAGGDGPRPPAPPRRGPVDPRGGRQPGPVDPGGPGGDPPDPGRAAPLAPPGPAAPAPPKDLAGGRPPLPLDQRGPGPRPRHPPAGGLPPPPAARRPLPGEPAPGALRGPLAGGPAGAGPAPDLRRELGRQVAFAGGRVDLRIEEPGARPVALSGLRRADLTDELLTRLVAANQRGAAVLFRPVSPSLQVLRGVSEEALGRAAAAGFEPALALGRGGRFDVVLRHPAGTPAELRPYLRRAGRLAFGLPAEPGGRPFLPAAGFLTGADPTGAPRRPVEVRSGGGSVYPGARDLVADLRLQQAAAREALAAELERLGLPSIEAYRRAHPGLGRRQLHAAWARQAVERGLGAEGVLQALAAAAGRAPASHLRFALRELLRHAGLLPVRRLVSQALPLPGRAVALALGGLAAAVRRLR